MRDRALRQPLEALALLVVVVLVVAAIVTALTRASFLQATAVTLYATGFVTVFSGMGLRASQRTRTILADEGSANANARNQGRLDAIGSARVIAAGLGLLALGFLLRRFA